MATTQLTSAASSISAKGFTSFEGLRASNAVRVSCFSPLKQNGLSLRSFRGLAIKAATTVASKYTSLKPLGDRVLVKIKSSAEKTSGGILLPSAAQTKPQAGEVVAVREGCAVGKNNVGISVKSGAQVVCSKYAGTEVELDGTNHLILKDDDIVGILETDMSFSICIFFEQVIQLLNQVVCKCSSACKEIRRDFRKRMLFESSFPLPQLVFYSK